MPILLLQAPVVPASYQAPNQGPGVTDEDEFMDNEADTVVSWANVELKDGITAEELLADRGIVDGQIEGPFGRGNKDTNICFHYDYPNDVLIARVVFFRDGIQRNPEEIADLMGEHCGGGPFWAEVSIFKDAADWMAHYPSQKPWLEQLLVKGAANDTFGIIEGGDEED